jgi:uncharacterized protein (TIGR02466 family)
MKTVSHNVFPTLVLQKENFLSINQCEDLISLSKEISLGQHEALLGDSVSSYKTEINFLNKVLDIKEKIQEALNEYTELSGFCKTSLSNSWINFQKKDSSLKRHTHPFSVVSGALYLNVDEHSSPIYFYNPSPYLPFTEIKKYTPYSYEYVWFKPKIGEMFLFPSWLAHGSDTMLNYTDDRVVLSFNTSPA